jgi:WD40 repeat protein
MAGPRSLAGDGPLAASTFSPDSHWLAIVYSNGSAKLLNLEAFRSGVSDASIALSESGVKLLAFSSDSRLLAIAGLNPEGKPAEMIQLWNLQAVHSNARPQILMGHRGEVHRLEFSSDGMWLAATGSPVATLWRLKGSAAEAPHAPIRLQGNEQDVKAMSGFSPDGRWFITAVRYESAARLWDLAAGKWSAAPRHLIDAENLRGQMITKDRRWLLAKDPADRLLLWSIENWKAPPKVLGRYPDMWPRDGATDVSVDGHRLVVAHEAGLFLWDLRSDGMEPRVLAGNLGPISDAGFSSADWVFAHDQYGSWGWDLTTGPPYKEKYFGKVEGHGITYRLIEPTDEPPPPPIELPEPKTDSKNFEFLSPDEKWTVVVNGDGVHLFPNNLEGLMEAAREAGVRNLTSEEWKEFFPGLPYRKTVESPLSAISSAQLTP